MGMAAMPAATRLSGSGKVRLAKGSDALKCAISIMAPIPSEPMSVNGASTIAGSPTPINSPQAKATAVSSIAGATSGAIMRFASGATSDRLPNW